MLAKVPLGVPLGWEISCRRLIWQPVADSSGRRRSLESLVNTAVPFFFDRRDFQHAVVSVRSLLG